MIVFKGWQSFTEEELVKELVARKLYQEGAARYVARVLKEGQRKNEQRKQGDDS